MTSPETAQEAKPVTMTDPMPELRPTSAAERIPEIDMLRGIAILGILMVNVLFFSNPVYSMLMQESPHTGQANHIAELIIRFFAEQKFISLFSMMFGLGAGVLYTRAQAKGRKFAPFFARRLLVLLPIGLVHAVVLWSGDILVTYALLGFLLIAFDNAKPRTLLIWFFVLMTIPLIINGLSTGAIALWKSTPGGAEQAAKMFGERGAMFADMNQKALQAYSTGNYMDILKARLGELTFMYQGLFYYGWNVLALFLLGMWFWKTGKFQNLDQNLGFFRKLLIFGLVMGFSCNLVYIIFRQGASPILPTPRMFVASLGLQFGAVSQMLFYVSGVILLARTELGKRILNPLRAIGRTALSNYLLQTLVFTTLFYSYGGGLFGRVGPAWCLPMVIGMFVIQILLSNWWVNRFRFGPVEWLWRSLTYWKKQPMRYEN